MKKSIYLIISLFIALEAIANTPNNAAQLFQSAKQQDDANRFDIALTLYLKADSAFVAENLGESAEYAQSLHNTGRAYLNIGNIEQGRNYTLKAVELRQKLFGKVSKEYITSLNNYALSYLISKDFTEALKYQTEVVDLCREMNPSHSDEGMYIINLARVYHSLENDEEAIKYMEEALPKVEKFGTNYEYILNFLGMVYMERGDNANINRIMALTDEHNRHELEKECNEPECHLERAEYYMSTGNPAKAKDEYMAVFAMELTELQQVDAYTKYARFLSNQKDFAQAGEYYAMSNDVLEKSEGMSENAISLLRQAGLCYFVGKEYDKAITAHSRVIAIVDRNGYSEKLKSSSLQGLGNAYCAKKDYVNSIVAFKQWIQHLRTNGHQGESDYAKAYERLASAEKFKGDYDESIADYDIAIDLYGKLGMYDEQQQASAGKTMCLAYARRSLGEYRESDSSQKQRTDKIRRTLQESLNTLEQGGDYLGKLSNARSLATIAGCYAQLEDYENAVKYYGLYIPAIREAIAEDVLLKSPKERELVWQTELSNIREMNAMLASLPQNPTLYAKLSNFIFDGQLLSKGILLSSNIEFDKVMERYGTGEMKSKYATIKNNLDRIGIMKKEHKPIEDILALTRETDALQLALSRQSAEFADFMNYLRVTSVDILPKLGNDSAVIEFVTLDTGVLADQNMIIAIALSKDYPAGIVIPITSVKRIKDIIADTKKFSNDDYGNLIWQNLLATVGDKKKIYFAPDGVLNNIGIEYLSVNGKPLSERIEISRLSSTREVVREHNSRPLQYASLFGGIDYLEEGTAASDKSKFSSKRASDGVSFSDLENTRREVDEIYAILSKNSKKTFEYTGAKASKAEFLSQDRISSLGLLHIATHGKYIDNKVANDAEAMSNSLMAFAGANLYLDYKDNDGIVTAAEIAKMSLTDCELVVLSACESGLGKLGNDGVFGLQRGFKNAGVKSMLVSLNEVADASTADMMIAFYRNLFDGKSVTKHEAFRKAQLEIRAKYPDDNTWASFILIDSFN